MRTHLNCHTRSLRSKGEGGVALILVMLSMLMLSVLAATIVFTARSETFASYNFRLDTEADYMAKAGIQKALNWFRSSHYQPVTQAQASTYYAVTSTGVPFNLYTSNTSPVTCISGCSTNNAQVKLIGYGSGSSNYPSINNTEATPRTITTAFASDLNDSANTRISGDSSNSGYFQVSATLLNYQTVNVSPPPSPVPSSCVVTTVVTCPVETWLITAKAIWTGASSSSATVATAEEEAIVQPIYWPTWGNALYGFCSVTMGGSAGTCTDAFNSALGPYAGGNGSVASGLCDQSSFANVISSGAGVGSNGYVDLGSNVTVGGNVTIGSSPTGGSTCCTAASNPACGFNGSASSVLGEVINGPHIDPPALPTYPAGFPPAASSNISLTGSSTYTLPLGATYSTAGSWPFTPPSSAPPLATVDATHCLVATTCNGSKSNPYLIKNISMTGNSTLNMVGGTSPLNPVYYDIECVDQTGGSINISGYVVFNVRASTCAGSTGLKLTGNGISNGIACTAPCTNIPPEALAINYSSSTKDVQIGGNGAIAAVINAPNADVSLGGGGANGYMVGAIQGKTVSVMGGYPIHYDVQLGRVGGSLGTMVSTAYGRKKM